MNNDIINEVVVQDALSDVTLPHVQTDLLPSIESTLLVPQTNSKSYPPRVLLLYGSLRDRSYSRLLAEECVRLLRQFGADTRIFNPEGLPLVDSEDSAHEKVQELYSYANWSEAMVWVSPERHGAMTGLLKSQIDWLPLSAGGMRPTQGKTLALLQVCGGSQSFNTVNQLRILGRWMRMLTIPNQSSVPKAWQEFSEEGRMKDSPYYNRVVDVMEELMKFTYLTRDRSDYLLDRYSERIESAQEVSRRVNQSDL